MARASVHPATGQSNRRNAAATPAQAWSAAWGGLGWPVQQTLLTLPARLGAAGSTKSEQCETLVSRTPLGSHLRHLWVQLASGSQKSSGTLF